MRCVVTFFLPEAECVVLVLELDAALVVVRAERVGGAGEVLHAASGGPA